ncbi:MAG: Tryptophan synthase alpha chain, partial [Labilithrix sp.]|nr:Tryptophan synthase alpha chain [Labilithrix sp.]
SPGLELRLVGAPASECGGQILVQPGAPDTSYLIDKLSSTTPAGGAPMPGTAGSLAADDIACIRSWIGGLDPSAATLDGGGDTGASSACEQGLTSCRGHCVDTTVDPKNCGGCGNACAVACAASTCVTTCPEPTTNCSNACVDLSSASTNCGTCGNRCPSGQTCAGGACSCGDPASFTSQIQPILTAECASSGCHVGVQPKGSLPLSTGKAYAALVNAPSSACAGKIRVVPGAVDQSYLMNKLTGVGMCAGTAMPKAGGTLAPAQLDLFRRWICNGAPAN